MEEVHILTTEQLKKLIQALGDGNNFPSHTDDPKVNYAVDCIIQGDEVVGPYDEKEYVQEIQASAAHPWAV